MEPADLETTLQTSVLRQAKEIVRGYSIILEPHEKHGFIGTAIELPTAPGKGKTPEACYEDTQETLIGAAAIMIANGKRPPRPASPEKRTTQVNVRFTNIEERALRSAALTLGFKGIGDFIRSLALQSISNLRR